MIAALIISLASSSLAADEVLSPSPQENSSETDRAEKIKLAEQYALRCLDIAYPDLTPDTRLAYCACGAEKAAHAFTKEELTSLGTGKGSASIDGNRMALVIQAPCLSFPLAEIQKNECRLSDRIRDKFISQQAWDAACNCINLKTKSYINEFGVPLMEYVLARNPGDDNALMEGPEAKLTQSVEFRKEMADIRNDCINQFGYR